MRSSGRAGAELRRGCAASVWFLASFARVCSARAEGPPVATGAAPPASTLHALAALSVGRGLRFNNPYRLEQPLGDTAESVSLSATYLDAGLGALFPVTAELEHGAALDALLALDGIAQFGITPSYLVQYALSRRVGLHGRVGIPIVVAPDAALGLEAAIGPHLPIAYGLGLTAELVGSVFFGAATEQRSVTTIPMLSLQLGVAFDGRIGW
jgi:hypothetical protein